MTNGFNNDYEKSLLRRVERAVQKEPQIIQKSLYRVRAIIGDKKATEQDEQANAALEMLREGETPSASGLAALELVVRLMRPAPVFIKGVLDPLPDEAASLFDEWDQFQVQLKPYLHSIGRIDRVSLSASNATFETFGTGFVVSYERDLLVTNKHVLRDLSSGSFKLQRGQAVVRFQREYKTIPDEEPVNILEVVDVSPTLDIALLRLEKTTYTDGRKVLPFNLNPIDIELQVVAIGYPCYDESNPIFVGALFGENFGVKRAAPGLVLDVDTANCYHDCSTLGGNSGSPLLSMKDASVVGLHHEGKFTYRNEAINANLVTGFLGPHLN
jgi:S1-C subfamily serine protease